MPVCPVSLIPLSFPVLTSRQVPIAPYFIVRDAERKSNAEGKNKNKTSRPRKKRSHFLMPRTLSTPPGRHYILGSFLTHAILS